ncbi:hypothetical protein J6590_065672 [Homalodisca vitripennis]|nr:hypothetical protein J6590_065672 [Homalodisca vitripennis]
MDNGEHRHVTPEVHEVQTGENEPNRCHCTGIECTDTSRSKCMKSRLERLNPTDVTAQQWRAQTRHARNWRDWTQAMSLHSNGEHRHVTPVVHEVQTGEIEPKRCHCTAMESTDTSRPKCMKSRLERLNPSDVTAQQWRAQTLQTGEIEPKRCHCTGIENTDTSHSNCNSVQTGENDLK